MRKAVVLVITCFMFLSACRRTWPDGAATPQSTLTPNEEVTQTLAVARSTPVPPTPTPTASPTIDLSIRWWIGGEVPESLRRSLRWPPNSIQVSQPAEANVRLEYAPGQVGAVRWVYALVTPFPNLEDDASLSDVQLLWKGNGPVGGGINALLVSPYTRAAFTRVWGQPNSANVEVIAAGDLQEEAWRRKRAWAIIPFEDLNPRWKVLRLDGVSVLDKDFTAEKFPLALAYALQGEGPTFIRVLEQGDAILPSTNRQPEKMTELVMTGVTAMVRGTAWMMDRMGTSFPGQTVRDWLASADITHISNEVPFSDHCPTPDPNDEGFSFCSQTKNIALLEYVGADVIELTGNHLNDYGSQALLFTLDLYKERGWVYFGGGEDAQRASQAVTLTHNGNRIAFIGCNSFGPTGVWASGTRAGAAKCDLDSMAAEIKRLSAEGINVIATFQFYESYTTRPTAAQYQDFRLVSDAGAVIVSGSHSHVPQAIEFRDQRLIHYGLGNLFFDQMNTKWPETRDEFIDRHIFYDNRLISTDLLTARLVDYTRPRPMTPAERAILLRRIFDASDWKLDKNTEWK